jgi:hypothetical protein
LRTLEAWHLKIAKLFGQLEKSARAGIDCQLSPDERAMIDRRRELQRALWRWALGIRG